MTDLPCYGPCSRLEQRPFQMPPDALRAWYPLELPEPLRQQVMAQRHMEWFPIPTMQIVYGPDTQPHYDSGRLFLLDDDRCLIEWYRNTASRPLVHYQLVCYALYATREEALEQLQRRFLALQ